MDASPPGNDEAGRSILDSLAGTCEKLAPFAGQYRLAQRASRAWQGPTVAVFSRSVAGHLPAKMVGAVV